MTQCYRIKRSVNFKWMVKGRIWRWGKHHTVQCRRHFPHWCLLNCRHNLPTIQQEFPLHNLTLCSLLCASQCIFLNFLHLSFRWCSRLSSTEVNDLFSSGLMLIVIGVVSKWTPMLLALILHWSADFSHEMVTKYETSWRTWSNNGTKFGCSLNFSEKVAFYGPFSF